MRDHLIPRLGVNIDHIATLRQLRNTPYPDLWEAAQATVEGGADQITVHLREDRRHIQDRDVKFLKQKLKIELNLEMALSDPIIKIALKLKPDWVCLVPEKRQEVTTEGGLDIKKTKQKLLKVIPKFKKAGIKVSLFIEPDIKVVEFSHMLKADAVEIHTGKYAIETQKKSPNSKIVTRELKKIVEACKKAKQLGLRPHAGHGLDYQNTRLLSDQGIILEYNIGHSIVCRAALVGMERAVREMKSLITAP